MDAVEKFQADVKSILHELASVTGRHALHDEIDKAGQPEESETEGKASA